MATSQSSDWKQLQIKESQGGLEESYQDDDAIAWEPLEKDLWIPYRIRGSWRGGVLG